MKKLYAILDVVANAMGPIMVQRHDSAAIRTFGDIASHEKSDIRKHVTDYKLVCLGHLDDDTHTVSGFASGPVDVLTGEQWLAAQAEVTDEGRNALKLSREA